MRHKENSKFRSLNVWEKLKDAGNDLPWYFAVSATVCQQSTSSRNLYVVALQTWQLQLRKHCGKNIEILWKSFCKPGKK